MRTPLSRVNSRRGRVTVAVLAVVLIFFTLFDRIVGVLTDWLWFKEVQYTQVFNGALRTRIVMFLLFGAVVAVLVAANLYLAYRLRPLVRAHSLEQHALERYRMLLFPRIGTWITTAALVVGFFAALSAQSRWQDWMLFFNSEPFGVKDPQFNVDVSFYVFEYPFWRYLLGVGFTTVTVCLLGSLALHYVFGGIRLQGTGNRMTAPARAHVTALVAAFVVLKAVAYFLDRRALVLSHNESLDLSGGGYSDIHALLPAKEILAWISLVVALAILVFSNAFMRNLVWPGVALGLLALSAIAIDGIYPAAVQSFTVKPSPLAKEAPYIQRSVDATRAAYGLTNVEITQYQANNAAPPANLASDQTAVGTVRLLDPHVVGPTYTQTQQVRGFYEFGQKLDIDRYTVDGQTQDYVVGARELNYASQITSSNWQTRHSIYTHGYGFVAAPANKVVCNGQPYFVSGFLSKQQQKTDQSGGEQCASPNDLLPTEQPRIYYGEQMGGQEYAIVGKSNSGRDAEFDRPTDAADQYYTYTGSGGVAVGSYWRRMLYSAYFRETNFLLSSVFNSNSKLLYVRNPVDRVHKVAPFLTLDNDPYPAVVNGKIMWILDGYTTASTYPYSQVLDWRKATKDTQTDVRTFPEARQDVNYVRNSVKATVDAYTGKVELFSFDDSDPVLKVWNKAFGGKLIKPSTEIPPELAAHFRYPEDQFKVQRDLLARFHVTNPNGFFSGQDFWQVPSDPAQQSTKLNQPPYYLLTKFPSQGETTFQLTAAVTPRSRQNLAALISGAYVGGKPRLQVWQLPDDTAVAGPVQIWQNMTSLPSVTSDLSLFERQSSQPVHGNLLSLPIGGGMLYVEPLYIQGKAVDGYPLMRKVIMAYGKYIAYADTLDQGLAQLVKQAGGTDPGTTNPNPGAGNPQQPTDNKALSEAVGKINQALADLKAAQQSGDFEAQGKALKALDDAVKAYQGAVGSGTAPNPGASASTAPPAGASPAAGASGTAASPGAAATTPAAVSSTPAAPAPSPSG